MKNHVTNILVLAVISIGVFFRSLSIEFVGDDLLHITYSWESFKDVAFHYFRPLTNLSLLLDESLWGYNHSAFHLTNLILHTLNTLLIYVLALKFENDKVFAFGSALFFLLLPVHSSSLFWISGRVDMLCAVFYLVTLVSYLKFQSSSEKKYFLVSLLSFFLALLSKEMALSIPLILTVYLWIYSEKRSLKSLRQSIWNTRIFWGVAILFAVFRIITVGYDAVTAEMHFNYNPIHLIKNLAIFLGLLVVPGGHIEISNFLKSNQVVFVALATIAVFILAVSLKWIIKHKALFFFALFVLISLLPVLRLAMRWYLYIPSIGFCLALSYLLWMRGQKSPIGRNLMPIAIAMIASVYFYFINIEQNRWLESGQLASQTSFEAAREIDMGKSYRCLILALPGEFEETPVMIHGYESLVNFSLAKDFKIEKGAEIHSAALVSIRGFDSNSYPIAEKVDSINYTLSLYNTDSYFVFPEQREIIAGAKVLEPGDSLMQLHYQVFVNGLNEFGQVNDISVMVRDRSLSVYYWTEQGILAFDNSL